MEISKPYQPRLLIFFLFRELVYPHITATRFQWELSLFSRKYQVNSKKWPDHNYNFIGW
jgi:hypothetical protein